MSHQPASAGYLCVCRRDAPNTTLTTALPYYCSVSHSAQQFVLTVMPNNMFCGSKEGYFCLLLLCTSVLVFWIVCQQRENNLFVNFICFMADPIKVREQILRTDQLTFKVNTRVPIPVHIIVVKVTISKFFSKKKKKI